MCRTFFKSTVDFGSNIGIKSDRTIWKTHMFNYVLVNPFQLLERLKPQQKVSSSEGALQSENIAKNRDQNITPCKYTEQKLSSI